MGDKKNGIRSPTTLEVKESRRQSDRARRLPHDCIQTCDLVRVFGMDQRFTEHTNEQLA